MLSSLLFGLLLEGLELSFDSGFFLELFPIGDLLLEPLELGVHLAYELVI